MKQYTPKLSIEERFWSKVAITTDINLCWEWQAAFDNNGYGRIKDNRVNKKAHRISWELTYGEIPEGLLVLHSCDNRKCCNPKHLFLGTNDDNMKDMFKKFRGNAPRKEANKNHKLTSELVSEIRLRYAKEKIAQHELAKQYNVSKTTIGYIILWKTWC